MMDHILDKTQAILTRLAKNPQYASSSSAITNNLLAVLVGLASGAGIYLFKLLIDLFQTLFFVNSQGILGFLGRYSVLLLPVIGGILVGLIVYFFVGVERHHGVAGIMESVAISGGRLRYNRMPAKALASALSIGSGASVGPEDPSVQIGANLGALVGEKLHLSDDRTRSLVAAGAAAGIAAAFNAPIAGVFFALEVILGQIGGSSLGIIVISAVSSAVFTQAVSGAHPAFDIPKYAFFNLWELPLFFILGLIAGPLSAGYINLLYKAQDILRQWNAPRWVKPAIAGLALGLVGVYLPQVFGVGYETIENILKGEQLGIGLLLALLVAKLFLTPLSIGAGFMGGVFAPSLFLGATLGAAYGALANTLFPSLAIAVPAFALVGMAAVLAGAVHAPLTAILLLFEMTNDYRIILPLMFAVVVSQLVSQTLQRDSVYTLGLARKGIRLDRGRDIEILQAITVSEVMQPVPPRLMETDSLARAENVFTETQHYALPVINIMGKLTGILTIRDLERSQAGNQPADTVFEAFSRDPIVVTPGEDIGQALLKMSPRDLGRLPVVSADDRGEMVGWLRRNDVIRAYDIALTRRAALRHSSHQVHLEAVNSQKLNVIEVIVQRGSTCENRLVYEVGFPKESMIASLRRGRKVIIPRGDTLLRAGDVLVVVAEGDIQQEIKQLCAPQPPQGSE